MLLIVYCFVVHMGYVSRAWELAYSCNYLLWACRKPIWWARNAPKGRFARLIRGFWRFHSVGEKKSFLYVSSSCRRFASTAADGRTSLSAYDPPGSPSIESAYESMASRLEIVRKQINRPLTYAEKIVYGHLQNPENVPERGVTYTKLHPDR